MKCTAFATFWHRFRADRRGSVAVIVALSVLGLVGTTGLGIDYFNALAAKTRLDLASDAAAIAAINTAQSYITANSGPPINQKDPALANGAIAAGQAQALKVFKSNAGSTMNIVAGTPAITVLKSGQTITASITYQAASNNAFGPLFGVNQFNVNGASASSLTMAKYLDFYLLLDVSASMGLPTTTAGQAQLQSIGPDDKDFVPNGCAFACHFSSPQCSTKSNPSPLRVCQNFTYARNNSIELRVDSVGNAVTKLLSTATATATIPNQYRVGLYPFINHTGTLYKISSNLTNAQTCAGYLGGFLDQGQSPPTPPSGFPSPTCSLPWSPASSATPYDNGGTHYEIAIPDLNALIPPAGTTIGTGSAASSPQPFVFLVTDGTEDNVYYHSGWSTYPQIISTLDPSLCTTLKNRGITVSVLYIPYQPIPNPRAAPPGNPEDNTVNALIPSIPPPLQACASPGFYFSAYTPQDITNAMQAMFQQALAAARLTQ